MPGDRYSSFIRHPQNFQPERSTAPRREGYRLPHRAPVDLRAGENLRQRISRSIRAAWFQHFPCPLRANVTTGFERDLRIPQRVFPNPPLPAARSVGRAYMRKWLRFPEEVPAVAIRAPTFRMALAPFPASTRRSFIL